MNRIHRSKNVVWFFRFMRLFGVTCFSIVREEENEIQALVAWQEDCPDGLPDAESTQEVSWRMQTDPGLDDALQLGEWFLDHGLIRSDMILDAASDECGLIGWSQIRFDNALGKLLEIRSHMLDEGKHTDTFFLHL